MEEIVEELGVSKKHIKTTLRKDRFVVIVHQSWLKTLTKSYRLTEFIENDHLEAWPQHDEDLGKAWRKIFIRVFKKKNIRVIPLPRIYSLPSKSNESDLSFTQSLHYVMQTNQKNLWKEAYKKYNNNQNENIRDSHISLTDHNSVLRETVIRAYGCPIINISDMTVTPQSKHYESHSNVLPAICAIETENTLFVLHIPYYAFTLQDCITFSPAILDTCYTKPLFIIFQLLQALRAMHDRGLAIGDLTLNDIYINENLWLQIMPQLDSNIIARDDEDALIPRSLRVTKTSKLKYIPECSRNIHSFENLRCIHCGVRSYDKVQIKDEVNLKQLCELWVQGQISNFTYLTALNNLSGRKYGEPNCHHVFPWVTDFSSRCGNNWRDLSKSKFRLNKGDRQLDLTYDGNLSPTQVAHHVSDVLSAITYYVYMARRTPKSVLCKNVRAIWVPAEYPNSIQRLQEWTPDECIPEFFTSPLVFKSIHEDLPDLSIPPWSSSPEDFIERHREALESSYVSERLHHWIDLTFGYKLSGSAAVKSKNVCLHLVDGHQSLFNSGVVQLFTTPHPARSSGFQSPWSGRLPPKLHFTNIKHRKKHRDLSCSSANAELQRQSEDEDVSSAYEEDGSQTVNRSPLALTRILSRSKTSLNDDSGKQDGTSVTTQLKVSPKTQKCPTFLSHIQPSSSQITETVSANKTSFTSYISLNNQDNFPETTAVSQPISVQSAPVSHSLSVQKSTLNSGVIYLPKEYNPALGLQTLESFHNFISKTFHQGYKKLNERSEHPNVRTYENTPTILPIKPDSLPKSESVQSYTYFDELDLNNAFTNLIFTESYEAKLAKTKTSQSLDDAVLNDDLHKEDKSKNKNYKQAVATRRIRELQVLGCLIVEIFMSKNLRPLGSILQFDFNERIKACLTVVKTSPEQVPNCIKYPVELLLQTSLPESEYFDQFRYPTITDKGLPPPSAHQLLQPLLTSSIFPFPSHFWETYSFLSIIEHFSSLMHDLEISTYFTCNGESCSKYESVERNKMFLLRKTSECKVKTCAKEIENLLMKINTNFTEAVDLLLPHIIEMIENPTTSVLAAWYLFDPIAKALGPLRTSENLLESILKLYETDREHEVHSNKIIKLYHHSFLLRLSVRLGLKKFLDNFVTSLVEAVGGYKDFDDVEYPVHNHLKEKPSVVRKTSNLKFVEEPESGCVLSPLDEDSSTAESDKLLSPSSKALKIASNIVNTESAEPEVFLFDNEEKLQSPDDNVAYDIMDKLDLNINPTFGGNDEIETGLPASEENINEHLKSLKVDLESIDTNNENVPHCPMSPTIPIPSQCHKNELVSIHCEVGSRKSTDEYSNSQPEAIDKSGLFPANFSGDIESPKLEEPSTSSSSVPMHSVSRHTRENTKISDISAISLVWLSHRLGPVLTARYLSRNLLRMLTLCYLGKENLMALPKEVIIDRYGDNLDSLSIANGRVVGDQNASRVLDCLASIAALYGEQFILLQYLPHMSELIAMCKRKMTANLEGGLVSCLALLKYLIPYLTDATLMDQLQDILIKSIINPCIRLAGTTKHAFPSGPVARAALIRKLLDTLYILSRRVGIDVTRMCIAAPALQRLFLTFDKVFGQNTESALNTYSKFDSQPLDDIQSSVRSVEESSYLELRRDGTTAEWKLKKGGPMSMRFGQVLPESDDSWSPPIVSLESLNAEENEMDGIRRKALDELRQVYTPKLAHQAYLPFLRYLGVECLDICLKNHALIRDLCYDYEQEVQLTDPTLATSDLYISDFKISQANDPITETTGSFGSNVSVVGNRIDVSANAETTKNDDILNLISNKMENTSRHLRGNWLAYWEHEIGRADKDMRFNFKQIKLQTFCGHVNSVKAIHVLDNENSFMSGSRDKTVKLWSLRSQGDGTTVSNPQWTYTGHKKSVLAITFIESLRVAASCDSTVHIWDPFMGTLISQLDGATRSLPINALCAMPAPSTVVLAATTDGTIRLIDTRLCSYMHELKVSTGPAGLIRCLAVSQCGRWMAAGHSTGSIAVLDTRTGRLLTQWRAHDGELLQIVLPDSHTLVTSSLDQTMSVWNISEGRLKFHLKGATEPVHCLASYNNELISGTTANRIGVHTSIHPDAAYSSTRLRSETFKGVLTSMAVLPLNKLLLLGADGGNISLLC